MKLRLNRLAALGLGLSISVLALPGNAGPEFKNKYSNDEAQVRFCDPDGTAEGDRSGDEVVYAGPDTLWPPNHKMQAADVTATEGQPDDDTDADVTLTLSDNNSEFVDEAGSGNTEDDTHYPSGQMASGDDSATVPLEIRSERSGQDSNGRTYVIDFVAEFDNDPKICTSLTAAELEDQGYDTTDKTVVTGLDPFQVLVPHDQRGGAGWK